MKHKIVNYFAESVLGMLIALFAVYVLVVSSEKIHFLYGVF